MLKIYITYICRSWWAQKSKGTCFAYWWKTSNYPAHECRNAWISPVPLLSVQTGHIYLNQNNIKLTNRRERYCIVISQSSIVINIIIIRVNESSLFWLKPMKTKYLSIMFTHYISVHLEIKHLEMKHWTRDFVSSRK